MSSMIGANVEIEQAPVLKSTIHRVSLMPSTFLASANRTSKLVQQRESMLKNMCNRITAEERSNIQRLANQEAKEQIYYLKKKMRRNVNNDKIEKMMGPQRPQKENYLKHVFSLDTEDMDLNRKYNKKINQRMGVMRQLQSIDSEKRHYKQWYQQSKNNVITSPNYTKVNYLLERMGNTEASILPKTTHNIEQVVASQERGSYGAQKRVFNCYKSLHNLKQV